MPTKTSDNLPADVTVFRIAKMDQLYLFRTVILGVLGVLVAAGVYLLGKWLQAGWLTNILSLVVLAITGAIYGLCWCYSRPKWFELSPKGMRIVWPGRSRKLPRGAFAEMRSVSAMDLGTLTRRLGISGVFGSFGWFCSEYMSNMDAYVTRHENMIYLRLKNRHPLLLTPERPEEFLECLKVIVSDR